MATVVYQRVSRICTGDACVHLKVAEILVSHLLGNHVRLSRFLN